MPKEGKQLEKFLKKEGITQGDFATALQVNQPVISKYITGKLEIPIAVIKFMHKKYQMSYEWFFEGTGAMKGEKENKRNLVSDLTDLRDTMDILQHRVMQLSRNFNTLSSDYYANKHDSK